MDVLWKFIASLMQNNNIVKPIKKYRWTVNLYWNYHTVQGR